MAKFWLGFVAGVLLGLSLWAIIENTKMKDVGAFGLFLMGIVGAIFFVVYIINSFEEK